MREAETDRFFDPWKTPKTPAAQALVRHIITDVEQRETPRQRRRRPSDQMTFETTVSAVTCDLMHYKLIGETKSLVITRSKQELGRRAEGIAPALNEQLPRVLDTLADRSGWIVQEKGQPNPFGQGRLTIIKPADRLLNLMDEHGMELRDIGRVPGGEVIILKAGKEYHGDKGKRLAFKETETTRRYLEEMHTINVWIAGADIEFDDTVLDRHIIVDPNQRQLRRVLILPHWSGPS